jgi:hypothetical protein
MRRIEMRATRFAATAWLGIAGVACANGERERTPAAGIAVQRVTPSQESPSATTAGPSPVPLATRPSDACGWIPAAEVEALIGKPAEPPRPTGRGCLYPLPMSADVAAMRERLAENNRKLGVTPERPWKDTPYGVLLTVGVGVATGERGVRLMGGPLASTLKNNDPASSGWDAVRLNGGRLGTITVTAAALTVDVPVPREKLRELTVRVRDRVPDLPFALPAGVPLDAQPAGSGDPCTLLTREEAESVLGKLVVAPYRSGNGGPLAQPGGGSCSYHTAKHHVLVVTPYRSGGKRQLDANRMIGGALDVMVADTEAAAADTIEGTWDETGLSRDGRLLLRKDDRAVELEYETSSTDQAGALRLGRILIERLAKER